MIDVRQAAEQVLEEVERQNARHPAGFPGDRNGIRAGIAALEDETREALDAWHEEKSLPPGRLPAHQWGHTREEIVQIAAVALRTLAAMPSPCDCMDSLGPGHEAGCPAKDPEAERRAVERLDQPFPRRRRLRRWRSTDRRKEQR
jgi:hypothetical protein